MSSAKEKKQFIEKIDRLANEILSKGGGDDELFAFLRDHMGKIVEVLTTAHPNEIYDYCQEHNGFRRCMNAINEFAERAQRGDSPLKTDSNTSEKLNDVMAKALFQIGDIISNGDTGNENYIDTTCKFLHGVISTAADLVELSHPGSRLVIYADMEAGAKLGGLRAIHQAKEENGSAQYSVSNIGPDDMGNGMNYLGQKMSDALFKGIHELPESLRNREMLLRATESLLANLLKDKFGNDNPHDILDSLCEHVHMGLDDLKPVIH